MVYLGLSWAILVYHGLSQAISGYLEISLAISCCLGLYRPISVYFGVSLGYIRLNMLSWAISGYLWLSLAISGYLGLSLAILGGLCQASSIRVPDDAGERKLLHFKLFPSFFCMTDRSYRGACAPKNNLLYLLQQCGHHQQQKGR